MAGMDRTLVRETKRAINRGYELMGMGAALEAALRPLAERAGIAFQLACQFELAQLTESVLANLAAPVEVTGFVVSGDDDDLRPRLCLLPMKREIIK